MKIKSGQTVKVLTGKDKGKTGKVIQVFPKLNKVVVDGVNKTYKHLKNKQKKQDKGERVDYFGPIHVSNVKAVKEVASEKKVEKKEAKTDTKKKATKKKDS